MQISDAMSDSIAQSSAGVLGTLNPGLTSLAVSMNASASAASSEFQANAVGGPGSGQGALNKITLPQFSQSTPATLEINLMSDYGINPTSSFSTQISALGDTAISHYAEASVAIAIDSSISGLNTVFSLTATEEFQQGVPKMVVAFQSPLISQPIFASDFVAGPNGTFSLDPTYRDILIPFTIPSGISPNFEIGSGTSVIISPEPASVLTADCGLLGLIGLCHRRRLKNRVGRRPKGCMSQLALVFYLGRQ